ncbi:MAG: DUF711 family protein [Thermofilaceae archaeon]|nr:DUF711 family protein [Thermofilaceae archaeon]MDW8003364.1 DUF711 family protein [Thermofilaceae archaeon]
MYKFRAATYHAPPASGNLDSYLSRLKLEEFNRVAKELTAKKEVWSLRVVSPPVEETLRILDVRLDEYVESFYEKAMQAASYVAFPLENVDSNKLIGLMSSFDRAYFSVTYREENVEKICEVLRRVPEQVGWVAASRFAVAFGERPVTPYFPVTLSTREGLSLSLLYPNHLTEKLNTGLTLADALRSVALEAYKLAYTALDSSGSQLPLLGVDLSLSPWGSESVAALLERILSMTLFSPGTFTVIRWVNEHLHALARSLYATGFNEVMLPLAEDDRLKELAAVGHLKFRDLLAATPACVTGVDMVPIPSSTEEAILRWIMRDLEEVRRLKGKPLGMRLLLVDAEPGDEVDLGMFGKTPVLDPVL